MDNLSAIRTRQSDISHGFRDGFDMLSKVRVTPSSQRLFVVLTDGETAVSNFEFLEKQVEKFSPTAGDPPIHLQIIMIGKVSMSSTIHKIENSKLFQSIADSCLGRFDQAETLADCLSFIASAPVLSTTPRATSIPLIVTPFLKFSCVYWSQVSKVSAPSLKKQLKSALSEFGGSTAKRDTSYRNPDDPDEEIFSEDRVKGFKYGSQFVPISGVEEEAFKLQGVNEIKVIGFVSKSRIPRHHYLEASIALQCNESRGFVALSSQMRNEGLVALARFVKKANGDPALVALIPSEFNPGLLCIQRLPVCEDYREYSFPSLPTGKQTPNSKLKPEQVDAVTSLVDELTIPALPTQFLSPVNSEIRNIHLLVEHRLRKSCGAPKTLPSPFIRLVSSSDKVDGAIHEVLNAFDLRARSGSKEKKRSYWSDILIQGDESKKARGIQEVRYFLFLFLISYFVQISVSSEGELPGTAPSFVEESSLHVGVETVAPELSVGSVSPVEDFGAVIAHYKQLMNAHDASSLAKDSALFAVKSAMVTFGEIITLLVSVGGSNAHYRKAMACLKVNDFLYPIDVSFHLFIRFTGRLPLNLANQDISMLS